MTERRGKDRTKKSVETESRERTGSGGGGGSRNTEGSDRERSHVIAGGGQ